jgi:uncharacterized protein (TIGR02145 family)
MNHLTIASLFLSSIIYTAQGQSITNVQAKQDNNTIVITYDLQGISTSNISLLYSDDGGASFIGPLKSVSGDIGENIAPGNKAITWNTLQDQEMLIGDKIIFRIVTSKFGFLTDSRDGKKYKTIQIGDQNIMAENLAFKPDNGNYWAYDNNPANVKIYGYLYNWETAIKVCPDGWHLPSKSEWIKLTDYLGEKVALGKLIEPGTTHWGKNVNGATNESGFTALPGGDRFRNESFANIGISGFWWSCTDDTDPTRAMGLWITPNIKIVQRYPYPKANGLSIRCFRD